MTQIPNINFNFINIKRAIMHQIVGKSSYNENTRCEFNDELMQLDFDIKGILLSRLSDAFGKNSKCFELQLENDSEGSTFSYMNSLDSLSDAEFIDNSKQVADLLAMSSNKGGIPGGFLLFLDCVYRDAPLYILLKAEPHDALSVVRHQTQALKDIILSPTQKLYKAFCMIHVNAGHTSQSFKYLLFDDQFNSGVSLAKYFYKDFLGLTISGNSALLTKGFYEKMLGQIKKTYSEKYDQKSQIEDLLYSTLTNQNLIINPSQVISDIIPFEDRDLFRDKICVDDFSESFTKDTSELMKILSKRRVDICKDFKICASSDFMSSRVKIEDHPEKPGFKIITIDTNGLQE